MAMDYQKVETGDGRYGAADGNVRHSDSETYSTTNAMGIYGYTCIYIYDIYMIQLNHLTDPKIEMKPIKSRDLKQNHWRVVAMQTGDLKDNNCKMQKGWI